MPAANEYPGNTLEGEEEPWPAQEDHRYVHSTLDQTIDIVRRVSEGQPPMTSGRDAFENMALTFAAERSAEQDGRIITREELGALLQDQPQVV